MNERQLSAEFGRETREANTRNTRSDRGQSELDARVAQRVVDGFPMTRSCISMSALFAMTFIAGCGSVDDSVIDEDRGGEAATSAAGELSVAQQQQQKVALAARDALLQQLLAKLMDTMASSGPASAIQVCQKQAPEIAANVGQEFGVTIGRTSHRLRNPMNTPPPWAQALVDDQIAEPRFVPLADDTLGALLPIRLKPQCLMCHGPEEQILPDVREALTRSYPKDRATGFREGDLRGWFWVTVPTGAQIASESKAIVESESLVPSADVNTSADQ